MVTQESGSFHFPALLPSRAISLVVVKWSPVATRVHASLFATRRRVRKIFSPSMKYAFFHLVWLTHHRPCAPIRISNLCQENAVCGLGQDWDFRKWGRCMDNTEILLERIKKEMDLGEKPKCVRPKKKNDLFYLRRDCIWSCSHSDSCLSSLLSYLHSSFLPLKL